MKRILLMILFLFILVFVVCIGDKEGDKDNELIV